MVSSSLEKRKYPRIHSHIRVRYSAASNKTNNPIYTFTNDFSEKGINLNLDTTCKSGDLLELDLFLDSVSKTIHTKGRIAWCENLEGNNAFLFRRAGIDLSDLDSTQAVELKQLIELETANKILFSTDEFLYELTKICRALNEKDKFIQNAQDLTKQLFAVKKTRLLMPNKPLNDINDFNAWLRDLKLTSENMIVPLIHANHYVGQLEMGDRIVNKGFSREEVRRIKHWATCLASFCFQCVQQQS